MVVERVRAGNPIHPFIAVAKTSLDDFKNDDFYETSQWKYAEEMPEPIKITHAQIKGWAGGEFKIVD